MYYMCIFYRSEMESTQAWFSTFSTIFSSETTSPESVSARSTTTSSTSTHAMTQANTHRSIPRYTELRMRTPTAIVENTKYNAEPVTLFPTTTAVATRKEVK